MLAKLIFYSLLTQFNLHPQIARYVMKLTCAEYEIDHPYGENESRTEWDRYRLSD